MKNYLARCGFTIVEILVAMAMIVTIVSMVYASYSAISRSTEVYKAKMSLSGQAQKVLDRVTGQIRCSYAPSTDALSGFSEPNSWRTTSMPESAVNYFYGDLDDSSGEILHLVTTNHNFYRQNRTDGFFDVTYKFDKNTATLFASQARFVPVSGRPVNGRSWQPILGNVHSVELTFFDGQNWLNSWDFCEKRKLPSAVKINIVCKDENRRQYYYSAVAYIYCQNSRGSKTPPETLMLADKQ